MLDCIFVSPLNLDAFQDFIVFALSVVYRYMYFLQRGAEFPRVLLYI